MKIYLIGVFHNFQTEKHPKFLDFLRDTCSDLRIKSIGEEMSTDALRLAKVEKSTVLEIAEEFRLPHSYCDPDEKERSYRGILGKQDLQMQQFFNNLSDEEIEDLKAEHYKKRESVWLEKIRDVFVEPMLFICGIQHLDSFSSLLTRNGFDCCLIEKTWSPN